MKTNFCNQGRSLIGVISVLVVIGLISGGLYYYLLGQTPEVPKVAEKNPPSTSTPAPTSSPSATPIPPSPLELKNSWVFILTHRGTPLPQEAVNFLCDKLKPAIASWIEKEAAKYQTTKPFSNVTCLPNQVLLPANLLKGGVMSAEGQQFTNPIDNSGVINFLENKFSSLKNAKYVTIFHYIPYDIQFANYMFSKKYDFNFIKTPFSYIPFYPELTTDNYGEALVHELMHKLGATDKYGYGSNQTCLTDKATGEPYSGYDIMCHRIFSGGVIINPTFSKLTVSSPTAKEIGWK